MHAPLVLLPTLLLLLLAGLQPAQAIKPSSPPPTCGNTTAPYDYDQLQHSEAQYSSSSFDYTGAAVAANDVLVVVGSPDGYVTTTLIVNGPTTSPPEPGFVSVFTCNGAPPCVYQSLIVGPQVAQLFGASVAIYSTTALDTVLIVGAPSTMVANVTGGAAYIYYCPTPSSCDPVGATVQMSSPQNNALFGMAVAAMPSGAGVIFAIGAPGVSAIGIAYCSDMPSCTANDYFVSLLPSVGDFSGLGYALSALTDSPLIAASSVSSPGSGVVLYSCPSFDACTPNSTLASNDILALAMVTITPYYTGADWIVGFLVVGDQTNAVVSFYNCFQSGYCDFTSVVTTNANTPTPGSFGSQVAGYGLSDNSFLIVVANNELNVVEVQHCYSSYCSSVKILSPGPELGISDTAGYGTGLGINSGYVIIGAPQAAVVIGTIPGQEQYITSGAAFAYYPDGTLSPSIECPPPAPTPPFCARLPTSSRQISSNTVPTELAPGPSDQLGFSLAVSNGVMAVGAPGGPNGGYVVIFEVRSNQFPLGINNASLLTVPGLAANAQFGYSVALFAQLPSAPFLVAVGVPNYQATAAGAVMFFGCENVNNCTFLNYYVGVGYGSSLAMLFANNEINIILGAPSGSAASHFEVYTCSDPLGDCITPSILSYAYAEVSENTYSLGQNVAAYTDQLFFAAVDSTTTDINTVLAFECSLTPNCTNVFTYNLPLLVGQNWLIGVAVSSSFIVVAASTVGGSNSAVYVFLCSPSYCGSEWTSLTAQSTQYFGYSVGAADDLVAVMSHDSSFSYDDDGGQGVSTNVALLYSCVLDASSDLIDCNLVKEVGPSSPDNSSNSFTAYVDFGSSIFVDANKDFIIVGDSVDNVLVTIQSLEDGPDLTCLTALPCDKTTESRNFVNQPLPDPPIASEYDFIGYSLSYSGNLLAVGAPQSFASGQYTLDGYVLLYYCDSSVVPVDCSFGSNITGPAQSSPPTKRRGVTNPSGFGYNVALLQAGSLLLVSAPNFEASPYGDYQYDAYFGAVFVYSCNQDASGCSYQTAYYNPYGSTGTFGYNLEATIFNGQLLALSANTGFNQLGVIFCQYANECTNQDNDQLLSLENEGVTFGSAISLAAESTFLAVADGGSSPPIVYVYVLTLDAGLHNVYWSIAQTITPTTSNDGFAQSLALTSTFLAVGAPETNGNEGAVYIYACTGGQSCDSNYTNILMQPWGMFNGGYQFGYVLKTRDNVLAVSAPGVIYASNPFVYNNGGSVSLFDCTDITFCMPIDNIGFQNATSQFAGLGVALSDSLTQLFVGCPNATVDDAPSRGLVYSSQPTLYGASLQCANLASPTPAPTCAVYAQSQRTFQDNEIVTSDPIFSGMQNMAFGTAIAYSGSILAVGAPHTTVGAPYDGAVFLFTCDESPGATTVECSSITPTLVPPTAPGSSSSMFGLGIALVNDGQNLVVTAPLFGSMSESSFNGAVFVYWADSGLNWNLINTVYNQETEVEAFSQLGASVDATVINGQLWIVALDAANAFALVVVCESTTTCTSQGTLYEFQEDFYLGDTIGQIAIAPGQALFAATDGHSNYYYYYCISESECFQQSYFTYTASTALEFSSDGSYLAMGLPTNNQVAVFACSGQSCGSTSVAVINTPNPDLPGGGFGTSLDWKDNIIAVGLVNSNTSSIYLFECDSMMVNCNEIQSFYPEFYASYLSNPDQFGLNVAIADSFNFVFGGVPDGFTATGGAVLGFRTQENGYNVLCEFSTPCEVANDTREFYESFPAINPSSPDEQFGYDTSSSGNVFAVSAISGGTNGYGIVYLYWCDYSSIPASCSLEGTLEPPVLYPDFNATWSDFGDGFQYGQVVELTFNGTFLAVSSPYYYTGDPFVTGAIFAYSCPTPSSCELVQSYFNPQAILEEQFGFALTLTTFSDTQIVMAASVPWGNNAGVVCLMSCSNTTSCDPEVVLIINPGNLVSSDAEFGEVIAIGPSIPFLAITAPQNTQAAVLTYLCNSPNACSNQALLTSPTNDSSFGADVAITFAVDTVYLFVSAPISQQLYIYACLSTITSGTTSGCYPSFNTVDLSENDVGSFGYSLVIKGNIVAATGSISGEPVVNLIECFNIPFCNLYDTVWVTNAVGNVIPSNAVMASMTIIDNNQGIFFADNAGQLALMQSLTSGPDLACVSNTSLPFFQPTVTPSPTSVFTLTESVTESATASYTESATASYTESATASFTESATASATASFTESATASFTHSATASATASFTESATASYTESATASSTEIATAAVVPATPTPTPLPHFFVSIVPLSPTAVVNGSQLTFGMDVPLTLVATVTGGPASTQYNYTWTCTAGACPNMTDPSKFRTPVGSKYLSVQQGVLSSVSPYAFTVTVQDVKTLVTNTSTINLYLLPAATNCLFTSSPSFVTPLNISTPISLGVTGCSLNSQYSITYQFAYAPQLNASLVTPGLVFLGPASSSVTSVSIPLLAQGNYTLLAVVVAAAGVGSGSAAVTSTYIGSTVVTAEGTISLATIQSVANTELSNALQSGNDSTLVTSLSVAILSTLNSLVGTNITSGNEAASAALRNQIVSAVISFASNQSAASNNSDLSGVLSVLQQASAAPSAIDGGSFEQITVYIGANGNQSASFGDAQNVVLTVDALILSQLSDAPALTSDFNRSVWTNSSALSLTADQAAALLAALRSGLTAFGSTLSCGSDAVQIPASSINVALGSPLSAGGLNLTLWSSAGSIITGEGFVPPTADDSGCSTYHLVQSVLDPYAFASNYSNTSICSSVLTIEFYDPSSNSSEPLVITGLDASEAVTVVLQYLATGDGLDATSSNITCVFWDETIADWSGEGCVKSDATTPEQLVCVCNHMTDFSIGRIDIRVTAPFIPPTIDLQSKGLIVTWCTIAGLVLIFIVLSVYALWKDAQHLASARQPDQKDLHAFIQKTYVLYDEKKVPLAVARTMHLSSWADAYGTNWYPEGTILTVWQRMYMSARFGFRYNHSYVSIFFSPISMGTRFARVCCTMTALFVNLAISAMFYQHNTSAFFDVTSIELKLAVGFITSIITFVPFTFIQFIMKRINRSGLIVANVNHELLDTELLVIKPAEKDNTEKAEDDSGSPAAAAAAGEKDAADNDAEKGSPKSAQKKAKRSSVGASLLATLGFDLEDDRMLARRTWLNDYLFPSWTEYVVYVFLFLLAVASIIVTGLFGADADAFDPTNDLTISWIESFFISVAVNIVILQTLQAVIGAVVTAIIGSLTSIGAAIALVVGSTIVAN